MLKSADISYCLQMITMQILTFNPIFSARSKSPVNISAFCAILGIALGKF